MDIIPLRLLPCTLYFYTLHLHLPLTNTKTLKTFTYITKVRHPSLSASLVPQHILYLAVQLHFPLINFTSLLHLHFNSLITSRFYSYIHLISLHSISRISFQPHHLGSSHQSRKISRKSKSHTACKPTTTVLQQAQQLYLPS